MHQSISLIDMINSVGDFMYVLPGEKIMKPRETMLPLLINILVRIARAIVRMIFAAKQKIVFFSSSFTSFNKRLINMYLYEAFGIFGLGDIVNCRL